MNFNDLLLPDLASYTSEKEYAAAVLEDLSPYFHIHREVPRHYPTGEGVRLDAVLRPRDPGLWFDGEPVFGVEFKLPSYGGTKDDVNHIRQAVDYSYCDFDGYGRIGIFLCPSPVLRHLRMARDVIDQHAARVIEESTIEYHRRWAASTLHATRGDFTEAELEHEAKKQLWKRKKQLRDIEAGAVRRGVSGRRRSAQTERLSE